MYKRREKKPRFHQRDRLIGVRISLSARFSMRESLFRCRLQKRQFMRTIPGANSSGNSVNHLF